MSGRKAGEIANRFLEKFGKDTLYKWIVGFWFAMKKLPEISKKKTEEKHGINKTRQSLNLCNHQNLL